MLAPSTSIKKFVKSSYGCWRQLKINEYQQFHTIAIVPLASSVSTGSVMATTATDRLTRSAYTLKKPKKASRATTSRRRRQNLHVSWCSLDCSLQKKNYFTKMLHPLEDLGKWLIFRYVWEVYVDFRPMMMCKEQLSTISFLTKKYYANTNSST